MRAFHRTHHAEAILRYGFRDGYYLMPRPLGGLFGVVVSADWPLDENEGADGDRVLVLEIPDDLFVEHEYVEKGKTYREAMIPAGELNRHLGTVRKLTEGEVGALTDGRWDSFGHGEGTDAA